jgi:hypothetical protein
MVMLAQTVEIITDRGAQSPSGPWVTVAVISISLIAYAVWLAFVYNRKK